MISFLASILLPPASAARQTQAVGTHKLEKLLGLSKFLINHHEKFILSFGQTLKQHQIVLRALTMLHLKTSESHLRLYSTHISDAFFPFYLFVESQVVWLLANLYGLGRELINKLFKHLRVCPDFFEMNFVFVNQMSNSLPAELLLPLASAAWIT